MKFTYGSGDRPLEGYVIKRGLGGGGFGEVYFAVSDGGKNVALKLIQRHHDVELRGEQQCLNLSHPNLVPLFDIKRSVKGETWVVMEYLGGGSLQDRLKQANGPLPVDEALRWFGSLASATDYLHEQGIVHRDLKPGNLLTSGDAVKLGDYGLSKFITPSRHSGQTESVGTVHYMAPEIANGKYGPAIDVYAGAVILFECLTGSVPYDGESVGEILMKHLSAAAPLERLPAKLRPVLAKGLAKDPAARYVTLTELHRDACAALGRPEAANAAGEVVSRVAPPRPAPKPAAAAEPIRIGANELRRGEPSPPPVGIMDPHATLPPPPGTLKAKRRALSDTVWAVFQAGAMAALWPAFAVGIELALSSNGQVSNPATYISLAVATAGLAAVLLVIGSIWEAAGTDRQGRLLTMLVAGVLAGPLVLLLSLYLNRPLAPKPDLVISAWEAGWAGLPAALDEVKHHLVKYAMLFGVALAVPDWKKAMSPRRSERVNLGWVAYHGGVALALAFFLRNPDPYWVAGMVGLTSLVVQWVSPMARRWPRVVAGPNAPQRAYA